MPELYGASAVFTLASTLELASDVAGDGYWHAHRVLEERGKLTHPAAVCPEARRQTRVFSQGSGWRTVESGFFSAIPGASR